MLTAMSRKTEERARKMPALSTEVGEMHAVTAVIKPMWTWADAIWRACRRVGREGLSKAPHELRELDLRSKLGPLRGGK